MRGYGAREWRELHELEVADGAAYVAELAERLERGPVYAQRPPGLDIKTGRWRESRRAGDGPQEWLDADRCQWYPRSEPPAPRGRGGGPRGSDVADFLGMVHGLTVAMVLTRLGADHLRRMASALDMLSGRDG